MKSLDEIAAELQGYDPQALPAESVNAFLAQLVAPVAGTDRVPLFAALGRVLAHDVISPISVPPHDNSAMDGYALAGMAVTDAINRGATEVQLTLATGQILAGDAPKAPGLTPMAPGSCIRITTGAVMPAGCDTVVPHEFARLADDGRVCFAARAVGPGDNRRLAGEDLMQGQAALRAGQCLTPAALGLLASLGQPEVLVRRRLRVAYFSTGDEILSLGDAPRPGAVYDSNRYTVFGLLTRLGCEVIDLGVVRDDRLALEAAFRQAGAQADAVITSGGVSVGEADHTKAIMRALGDVAFWRIAMRPGRPMAVGRLSAAASATDGAPDARPPAVLFGLPGNPVAVMVTFLAFVRPALLRMMGATDTTPPLLRARCAEPLRKKPGRTEYQRGIVWRDPDGELRVRTTGNQGSGVLRSMVEANGLIVLHHSQASVAVGDLVDVMMFEGTI